MHARHGDVTVGVVLSRAIAAATATVVLACSGAGCRACDSLSDTVDLAPAPSVPPPPSTDAEAPPPPTPEALAAAKLARYAECLYITRPAVDHSQAGWRATVGQDGLPRKRRVAAEIVGLEPVRGPCDLIDRQGAAMAPAMPTVEGAAATYIDALRQLSPATQALATYYRDKAFNDDDWAQGKALATDLRGAFGRFDTAAAVLQTAVDTDQAALGRVLMTQCESQQGQTIRWHAHAATLAARAWTQCFAPTEATPAQPAPTEAAAGNCESAQAALSAAAADFAARRRAHPDEAAEVFWLTAFAHSLGQLSELAARPYTAPPVTKTTGKAKPNAPDPTPEDRAQAQRAFAALVLDYGQLGL